MFDERAPFGKEGSEGAKPVEGESDPETRDSPYLKVLEWLRRHAGVSSSSEQAAERASPLGEEPLPFVLNRIGAVGDADLQAALISVSGASAASSDLDLETANRVSPRFLKSHRALPLMSNSDDVLLGLVDPFDEAAVRGVQFATGRDVRVTVMRAGEHRRLYSLVFDKQDWSDSETDSSTRVDSAIEFNRDAPVARKVAGWLAAAVERRASDVHIEPRAHALVVRFRIDGVLETIAEESLEASPSVVARIKVLADLDLGDRRSAQDGRATIVIAGRPIDLRVSVVPSVNGEAVVLRILDRAEVRLTFENLGFCESHRALLSRSIGANYGLIVVCGPTGSGKTTTLYAALDALRETQRKIVTIEDPVEFFFDHVTQVQYAPKAGVTFPSAVRAFLRQDPDVIMVGEIRDGDTARAAVQAALTGHLVLASLHAIDAPRAIPRLLDMGVEPFQLAACLRTVVAQRLVRRLCLHCRSAAAATNAQAQSLGFGAGALVYEPLGCAHCAQSGYVGRLAIAEALEITPAFAESIRLQHNTEALAAEAIPLRMKDDGRNKCLAGLTSIDDVLRALSG